MDKRKGLYFTIIGGLAGLFFLTTRFYIPMMKNNAQCLTQYKQLKTQVETIGSLSKAELDVLEAKLENALSNLEKSFPASGELKLTEQLARVPEGADIVFTNIAYQEPFDKEGYRVFPVEVNARAAFYDFLKYLAEIETNPSLIGVGSLALRRTEPDSKFLDIEITFLGFRLTRQFPAISKYLQDKYKPFNKHRLDSLLEPVKLTDTKNLVAKWKDYNPFADIYNIKPKVAQSGREKVEFESLSLQGILRIADKKAALINDVVVKEGESIAGMQVEEIQDYKVVLSDSGKKYILKMGIEDENIKY